jgi:hypothetical protein
VAEIRIYFEGHNALRPGFSRFFSELRDLAREKRCGFNLIATGGTPTQDFAIGRRTHPQAFNILLLDSERADDNQLTVTLIVKEKWEKSLADSIFWMVHMMEAWFHADKEALKDYYRDDRFNAGAMSANPRVEEISKKDLMDGLKEATKRTKKGEYHKTKHAPDLLAVIAPERVRRAAPNCKKLFDRIFAILA